MDVVGALQKQQEEETLREEKQLLAQMSKGEPQLLPPEVFRLIFRYLSTEELSRVSLVCRAWRRTSAAVGVWQDRGYLCRSSFLRSKRRLKPILSGRTFVGAGGDQPRVCVTSALFSYPDSDVAVEGELPEGACGKTALVTRLCSNYFSREYDQTIADGYRKTIEVDGYQRVLSIEDTSADDRYQDFLREELKLCHVFMICSFLESYQHLRLVEERYQQIRAVIKEPPPLVLVQTMTDCATPQRLPQAAVAAWVRARQPCSFVPTSALLDENVDLAFKEALRLL